MVISLLGFYREFLIFVYFFQFFLFSKFSSSFQIFNFLTSSFFNFSFQVLAPYAKFLFKICGFFYKKYIFLQIIVYFYKWWTFWQMNAPHFYKMNVFWHLNAPLFLLNKISKNRTGINCKNIFFPSIFLLPHKKCPVYFLQIIIIIIINFHAESTVTFYKNPWNYQKKKPHKNANKLLLPLTVAITDCSTIYSFRLYDLPMDTERIRAM